MREIEVPFELKVNGRLLKVSEHELAGKRVFHVNFGASVKPLVITVAIAPGGKKFWTSIPQAAEGSYRYWKIDCGAYPR